MENNNNNGDFIINLNHFIEDGLEEKVAAALEKACLIVEADAKRNCPVDDGSLRQSITHEVDKEAMEGVIGTPLDYAPFVEKGTGIYAIEGNGRKTPWLYKDEKTGEFIRTRGQHPQPFLEPAMESNKKEITKCFEGIV